MNSEFLGNVKPTVFTISQQAHTHTLERALLSKRVCAIVCICEYCTNAVSVYRTSFLRNTHGPNKATTDRTLTLLVAAHLMAAHISGAAARRLIARDGTGFGSDAAEWEAGLLSHLTPVAVSGLAALLFVAIIAILMISKQRSNEHAEKIKLERFVHRICDTSASMRCLAQT